MEAKYKIGYIDEDVKQVKKYQRRFRNYDIEVVGYEFHKGMTLDELMYQVYESDIDLLMIDYKLNETNQVTFNGEAVESEFYDKKPLFPHIIFTNKVEQAEPHVEDWKIIFDKDDIFSEDGEDEKKVQHFITTLIKSIEQYRNHVNKKKAIVSELLEKGEKEGLTATEKDLLITKQDELIALDKTERNEIPKHLLTEKKLDDLSKTKKEAEEFLQSLIDKRKK
ncbi:hypothetical protein [Leeuwenhoekiella marinoflava]|uniref:Uncharacterized protein n=2 Tax=Leeuwenhoekiella marinoflava TaxID=988 RepID=A0A4Q0PNA0_9FLAO|nr:hypothetical protein [Leeuwenhoekiella marinoflava]RXG31923.1 hypothetical protein DSL99_1225 [Leeuwenhoekiella marinoflava]SHE91806.1 hypothetical protein SAMN02745246_01283 [Leeuwenhoekiella marinoflava DSM 3653]